MKSSKKFWELRAKQHGEKAIGNLSDPLWDRQENKLRWIVVKKYLQLKKIQRVLEVGCGSGYFAIKAGGGGIEVSANDISLTLISIARENALENGVNIDFHCCAIKDLNYSNNSFDFILSVAVLQHIIDIRDFQESIKKMIDMVKYGGTIAIVEYSPVNLSQSFNNRLRNAQLMVARTRDEWISEFENLGARFYEEQGVRYYGYYYFLGALYRDGLPSVPSTR